MARMVDKTLLERIRAANDIVDVIGGYLPLKRAGANWVALCPFHKEKSPSFNVNPHRQIFHCFGCQKGGDVFTFVREYENIGFMDAVRRLAERARIPIILEEGPGADTVRHQKDVLLEMHEQITQRWQAALANDAGAQKARDYLQQRGVTDEAVKLFRIGCAPEAWDDTVNWARSRNYNEVDVEKAGLIVRKEGSDRYYDRFRGRLMFPICDEQGRVIAFSGRLLDPDAKTAKYVNSPETPIFTKGRILFGLDKAKRRILDVGFAVVCEGQLDTIACHTHGIANAVAPQGTALTATQARVLRRFTEDLILCFDADKAGKNATARAFDELLEAGIFFRVAELPPQEDPDSYLRKNGKEAFLALLNRAEEFHDFHLRMLCESFDVTSNHGRMKVVRAMYEALQKRGSNEISDRYIGKTASRLGITKAVLQQSFANLSSTPLQHAAEVSSSFSGASGDEPRPSTAELWLLRILLTHGELVEWAAMHLAPEWVEHAAIRRIVEYLYARGLDESGVAGLLEEFSDPAVATLITQVAADNRTIPNASQQLADIALKLRNACVDRQLAALLRRMEEPDATESHRLDLLRQQQQLRASRREPISPRSA